MKAFFVVLSVIVATSGSLFAADIAPAPKPSQFLGILRLTEHYHVEGNWDEAAKASVGRHFKRLKEFSTSGKVILAGRTQEAYQNTMGLVIFEAKDMDEARRFMADDPAVEAGVMSSEVRPYMVAVVRDQAGEKPAPKESPAKAD